MIDVSIVIVAYKAKEALQRCVDSIPKKKTWEVIVVDNSEHNRGFAAGCNVGAKRARGRFLFFLNPDCVVQPGAIERLAAKLKKHPGIGMVAPQLVDTRGKAYLSYSMQPTASTAPIVYSFLNAFFPHNRVSAQHWMHARPLNREKTVGIVSGAALMLSRELFESLGRFDERFFMYWEEVDLCRRVIDSGMRVVYVPNAVVMHEREGTTPKGSIMIKRWFRASRFVFFRKHFGLVYGLVIETWLTAQEEWRLLLIVAAAAFLRLNRLPSLMPLLGDQGRDFLAALEALKTHTLPLLGIPSSMPQFRQGPVAVWLWMGVFSVFGLDPVAAGMTAALLSLAAVVAVYVLAEAWWGRRAAWVSALILATAPLAVTQGRMAFHTNPIPLVSAFYLWALSFRPVAGRRLLVAGLAFALLFQLELAHFPLLLLWGVYAWPLITGKRWRAMLLGAGGILVGLWPQIVYDLTHRFTQLTLFVGWTGYRLASFIKPGGKHAVSLMQLERAGQAIAEYWQKFWAWGSLGLTVGMSALVVGALLLWFVRIRRLFHTPSTMVCLWIVITLLAYVVHGGPSEAYFPSLFVPLALMGGWVAAVVRPGWRRILNVLIVSTALFNGVFLWKHNFLMASETNDALIPQPRYGAAFAQLRQQTRMIERLGGGDPVALSAMGPGDEFASTLDNYRFLLQADGYPVDSAGVRIWVVSGSASLKPPFSDSAAYFVDGITLVKHL